MTLTQLVARGTIRLLAGVFAARALDFVLYLLLARSLGVEQFGRHTFALSFTLLFTVLADLGVGTVFQREAAQVSSGGGPDGIRRLLGTALRIKGWLAVSTLVVTLGVSLATGASIATLTLVGLFTAGLLLNSTAMLFEGLLKVAGRPGAAGLAIAGQAVVSLGVGATLLATGGGVRSGAWAYLIGALVHMVGAVYWSRALWARRATSATEVPHALGMRALIRQSLPLAATGIFIAVYFRLNSVLLNAFEGPNAVGLYGSIYRFFEAMVILSAAYRSVLFPFMSRRADGPTESLAVLCRKSFRLHLMLTIGVAVVFTVQAPALIELLLGSQYLAAAPALRVLMWALPGAFMADTLLHLLVAQRRQIDTTRAVAITAIFNVALNLILIPRWSIVGAAVATVASELLSFALMFVAFTRTVPVQGLAHAMRAPVLAGIAAALVMSALGPVAPDGIIGLLVSGSSGVMVYLLSLVGLGAIGREEVRLLRELIPVGHPPSEERDAA